MWPEKRRHRKPRKFCVVQNCKLQTAKYGMDTLFAQFPAAGNKNALRNIWLHNLRMFNQQNTSPPAYSYVCGKHFDETCFSGLSLQIGLPQMCTGNPVPTIFPIFRSYVQRQSCALDCNNTDKKKSLKRKRSYRSRSRSTRSRSTRSVSIPKNTNRSKNGRFSAANVETYAHLCQRCEIRLTDFMQFGLSSVSLNRENEIDEISDQDNNASENGDNNMTPYAYQESSYDIEEYSEVTIDLTMDEDDDQETCFGGFNEYEVVKSERVYGSLFIMEHQ